MGEDEKQTQGKKEQVKMPRKRPAAITLEMAGVSANEIRRIVAKLKEDEKNV